MPVPLDLETSQCSHDPNGRQPAAWTLLGIDFTSAPRKAKPITCCIGRWDAGKVRLAEMRLFTDFAGFEALLGQAGPWLAACDFPFGLPRSFVRDQRWPENWSGIVSRAAALSREEWRALLDAHRAPRPAGDRTPHRATDHPARSHSPLKLVNPPVALMFHEGAPRLLQAGVSVPGMHEGDPQRVAIEAYPGLWARRVEGASYKADDRARQTPERRAARGRILEALERGKVAGIEVAFSEAVTRASLLDDATGDRLDAALCTVQAACALQAGAPWWGLPEGLDPVEGWIIGAEAPSALNPGA